MSQSSHAVWWQAAPPANEAHFECLALHREFVAERLAAAAQLRVWARQTRQSGQLYPGESVEVRRLAEIQSDFAHWVWVFEMDERERALLRRIQPEAMSLCEAAAAIEFGGSTSWFGSFGFAACEPGQIGARRFARAGFLLQRLRQAMEPEEAPFMVEGVDCGLKSAELRGEAGRPAAWNRQPWVDALAKAYPDLAAEGLFSDGCSIEAGGGEAGGAKWRKKKACGFPRPPRPSSAAQGLFQALGGSSRAPKDPWPTSSLRAWLESLELEASSPSPAGVPAPRL